MSETQHIHFSQLSVSTEGEHSRDGNILRMDQHIWEYGFYNAHCTAGKEALQLPFSCNLLWKNCSRFMDCNGNERLYLLIVFDLIVHDVRRRLFDLWPGEGDAVVRGRVFPDLSHQSRTCRDTTKPKGWRTFKTCLNKQRQEGSYP